MSILEKEVEWVHSERMLCETWQGFTRLCTNLKWQDSGSCRRTAKPCEHMPTSVRTLLSRGTIGWDSDFDLCEAGEAHIFRNFNPGSGTAVWQQVLLQVDEIKFSVRLLFFERNSTQALWDFDDFKSKVAQSSGQTWQLQTIQTVPFFETILRPNWPNKFLSWYCIELNQSRIDLALLERKGHGGRSTGVTWVGLALARLEAGLVVAKPSHGGSRELFRVERSRFQSCCCKRKYFQYALIIVDRIAASSLAVGHLVSLAHPAWHAISHRNLWLSTLLTRTIGCQACNSAQVCEVLDRRCNTAMDLTCMSECHAFGFWVRPRQFRKSVRTEGAEAW